MVGWLIHPLRSAVAHPALRDLAAGRQLDLAIESLHEAREDHIEGSVRPSDHAPRPHQRRALHALLLYLTLNLIEVEQLGLEGSYEALVLERDRPLDVLDAVEGAQGSLLDELQVCRALQELPDLPLVKTSAVDVLQLVDRAKSVVRLRVAVVKLRVKIDSLGQERVRVAHFQV